MKFEIYTDIAHNPAVDWNALVRDNNPLVRHEFLHFEAGYYRGIDFCIAHGLALFEPAAQGEHKIARGFVPQVTRSARWLADVFLRAPIEQYVARDKAAVLTYKQRLDETIAYKKQ